MRITDLKETFDPDKVSRIKSFVKFCVNRLNLKTKPRIKLTNRVEATALGYFSPDTGTIVVVVKDRHQMDIMRTLAHELVHLKQSESRKLDGSTGSRDENQANAMAGVLLRVWGQMHPEYFAEERKFTDLEIAIMEGGGSIDDNRTYAIRKQLESAWREKLSFEDLANDFEFELDQDRGRLTVYSNSAGPLEAAAGRVEFFAPDDDSPEIIEIAYITVLPKYQKLGLATEMWKYLKRSGYKIINPTELTSAGKGLLKSLKSKKIAEGRSNEN